MVLEQAPVRSAPPVNLATGAVLAMVTTEPTPVIVLAAEVCPCVTVAPSEPAEPVTAHPRKLGIVTLTRLQRLTLNETASAGKLSDHRHLKTRSMMTDSADLMESILYLNNMLSC